jgi:L-lactate dehydrogenase (cytochrome)
VPLILKGVQCWEDALQAYDEGLAGVVLSNHGGRQLDFARSGIEVLVEVVIHLKQKRGLSFPNDKFSLFVDGGVRRATDVLKAIALGASAGMEVRNPVARLTNYLCSRNWSSVHLRLLWIWPSRG